MSFFMKVDGESAITVEKGVYRSVELYTRDGMLYAKAGTGFVRLKSDGSTSKLGGNLRLDFMSWNGKLAEAPYGYLCTPDAEGARPLAKPVVAKLLGPPPSE